MGWLFSNKCSSKVRLDGKTAIITGANAGIGYYTAMDLYKRGARVILACRNLDRARTAVESIAQECEGVNGFGQLAVIQLDLSSLESIRQCAQKLLKEEEHIHLLINNAGNATPTRELTVDGYEIQFATNHLGHFLLTLLLLPRMIKSAPARIVNVSSAAHFLANGINFEDINSDNSYSMVNAYCHSKLANVLFTRELATRLEGTNVNVYVLNPGSVKTKMGNEFINSFGIPGAKWVYNHVAPLFIKTPLQGAQTTIYCAVSEEAAQQNGLYYSDCQPVSPSRTSQDRQLAEKLWDLSVHMVHLENSSNPFIPD